jgi:hypothetical protein
MSKKTIPKVPNFTIPLDPSVAVSLWECDECGSKLWFSQEQAADVGTPVCGMCDQDMVLAENKVELTGAEVAVIVDLATFALADADIYDTKAREHGLSDKDMKALQEKLNVIRQTVWQ